MKGLSYLLSLLLLAAAISPAHAVTGYARPPDPKRLERLERQRIQRARDQLHRQGYVLWDWDHRAILPSGSFTILPLHNELTRYKAADFIAALSANKAQILELYKDSYVISDAEYILLAHMAIGFLGAESEFFRSPRYQLKEACSFCVAAIKWAGSLAGLTSNDRMSRGPIQMKQVPDLIEDEFDFDESDLNDPESSARAIMGYLIEALIQLKRLAENHDFTYINEDTYVDYLPYLYFGSRGAILRGTATPDKNLYIQRMRQYMPWVEIYAK